MVIYGIYPLVRTVELANWNMAMEIVSFPFKMAMFNSFFELPKGKQCEIPMNIVIFQLAILT